MVENYLHFDGFVIDLLDVAKMVKSIFSPPQFKDCCSERRVLSVVMNLIT